tara:strand:- start:309 stop:8306 length:7998 start_codon:yes stop_codon:yes gene_type:complete
LKLIRIIIFIITASAFILGESFHVSVSGSDETGDGSQSNPFASIQTGLNACSGSDTVLVSEGVYNENITWPSMQGINLIGSGATDCIIDGDSLDAVINMVPSVSSIIDTATKILGFTIQNGLVIGIDGGGIRCLGASPYLKDLIVKNNRTNRAGGGWFQTGGNGGGIYFNQSNSRPILENIYVSGNIAESNGGGMYFQNSDPIMKNVVVVNNRASSAGGIFCAGNLLFMDHVTITENFSNHTNGLYYSGSSFEMKNSIVWENNPNSIQISVLDDQINISYSNIRGGWEGVGNIDANPLFCILGEDDYSLAENSPCAGSGENGTYIGAKDIGCPPIYEGTIWYVDIFGSDMIGDGSSSNPFSTIQKGILSCNVGDTVQVASGNYLENIIWPITNGIKLIGTGADDCIIDGNQNGSVITFDSENIDSNTIVTGFKLKNGSSSNGGGIYCRYSNPTIINVILSGNYSDNYGGGIHLYSSDPIIKYVTIANNSASRGGGLYLTNSNPSCNHITITDNSSSIEGGGIYIANSSNVILQSSIIWGSNPNEIIISDQQNSSISATYSNIRNGWIGIGNIDDNPLFCSSANSNYSLAQNSPCLNTGENGTDIGAYSVGCLPVLDSPVHYVSSNGSDENGDGSIISPFASIQKGLSISNPGDSVLVGPGTYIENINWPAISGIKLIGDGESECIIDGGQNGTVIRFNSSSIDSSTLIRGFTLQNGLHEDGGGIYMNQSSPSIEYVTIINNTANFNGGAITLLYSSPILKFVTLAYNSSINGTGGIYCGYYSNPVIMNATITENSTESDNTNQNYGGIYCLNSSAPTLLNSIVWGNYGYEIFISSNSTLNVSYSNIRGDWEGIGNIDSNPLFCNSENNDFSLAENSECIGSGYNGVNIGSKNIGCATIFSGPVWHISPSGSDQTGDGSESNPFFSIGKGINYCNSNDTVLVGAGTYYENIIWPETEGITLIGSGETDCILDGEGNRRIFYLDGVDSTTSISNFKIQNGSGTEGGGIFIQNSSLSLSFLTLKGNDATRSGYGGPWGGGDDGKGGGIYCNGSTVNMNYLTIVDNSTNSIGGGICLFASDISLNHVTVYGNSADDRGNEIFAGYNSNLNLSSSIVWGPNSQIYIDQNGIMNSTYSNIRGNLEGEGNIDSNPLFCDPDNGDFTLAENSPCLYRGENGSNMGPNGMGCGAIYNGPIWYVSNSTGSDETGDGSQTSPFLTIQEGINNSSSGDTVLAGIGIYTENIYWPATNGIKLIGISQIDCIIDGNQNGSVISFNSSTIDSTTILKDFRIQNGGSTSPMIPSGAGSGIEINESSPTIAYVTISGNSSSMQGGGISMYNSNVILDHVTIVDNISSDRSGGIYCAGISSPAMKNVTITGNKGSALSSGLYCDVNTSLVLKNSILWGNDGIDVFVSTNSTFLSTYSNIRGGWEGTGNFDANPLFCNPDSSIYSLAQNSPCIGASEEGLNIGSQNVDCGTIYSGPTWNVSVEGSDLSGDGSQNAPFLTIRRALNSTNTGDTILVTSGRYFENIVWPSTNGIKLIGSGPTETILDGSAQGTVILIRSSLIDTSTLITGFFIQNGATFFDGYNNSEGGGIYLNESSPTITNLIIADNSSSVDGSAITLEGASPVLKNVTITDNYSIGTNAGAFYSLNDAYPDLQNCIIWGNHGGDLQANGNSSMTVNYSNIRGTWAGEGNINANPLFCNENINNYTLAENSPCIGSGANGENMGANNIGCGVIYAGPDWYVSDIGSDQNGDGSYMNPFATIQRGIDYCNIGDTVKVSAGTYNENINWPESNGISLIGSDAYDCIIDGNQNGSAISIDSELVDSNTVINGFTIQNGYNYYGGGINIINASPSLENLIITSNNGVRGGGLSTNSNIRIKNTIFNNNSSNSRGGGAHFNYSNATLVNVIFQNNNSAYGGGIYLDNSSIFLKSSSIVNNASNSRGGGMYLINSNPIIENITLANNNATFSDQLYCGNYSNPSFVNSIIWGDQNPIELLDNTSDLSATYCDIMGGWSGIGNIDSNPLFCEPDSNNYSLAENSPCIGSGLAGANIGSKEIGCGPIYNGPVWHVSASAGSDEIGDGSENTPYISIQKALYKCNTSDTIIVAEGIYNENLIWPIKRGIKLIGAGPENCIVDGGQNGTVMTFNSSLIDFSTMLKGFQIRNGLSSSGGGINCIDSYPVFENVIIVGNSSDYGGGIYCTGTSRPKFENSTIIDNSSANGGGVYCTENANPNFKSCIIWGNNENQITDLSGLISISFSNIRGGWSGFGNIEARPLFCNPGINNYLIAENSPCVGTGENGTDMGALGVGCDSLYLSPVYFVDVLGSDQTGDGSQGNPFGSIQKGINETISGDTVFVSAGSFVENIIWPDRNIKLIGSGPGESIIDGSASGSVIRFDGSTTNVINLNSVISGFTIKNGYSGLGGGIYIYSSSPLLENLLISQNISYGLGGGLYFDSTSTNIRLTRSTIIDNQATFGGSGVFNSASNVFIDHCIVWSDSVQTINADNGMTYISFSNILGGWDGNNNMNIDPLFCNPDSSNYSLAENSQCIGSGQNGTNIGAFGIGCSAILGIKDVIIPIQYELFQNYPNPFNPKTYITYDIPEICFVELYIFDIMGRKIKTIAYEKQNAGRKQILWDATNSTGSKVSAGMYFYMLKAGDFRKTKKMILLK